MMLIFEDNLLCIEGVKRGCYRFNFSIELDSLWQNCRLGRERKSDFKVTKNLLHRLVSQSSRPSSSKEVGNQDYANERKKGSSNGDWNHVIDIHICVTLLEYLGIVSSGFEDINVHVFKSNCGIPFQIK